MRELAVSIIFSLVLVVIGIGIFSITQSWTEVWAVVVGVLWGMTVPVMTWGLKDKRRLGERLAKLVGLYDPLYGTPTHVKNKIRHYDNRSDLPRFDSLLSLNDLTSIDVLSISSYVITLVYIEDIKKALSRGVKFNFLILNPNPDPTSDESLRTQSNNYPTGRKLKQQINDSLEALCKAGSGNVENLEVRVYDGIIDHGILIAHFNNDDKIWMKIENYNVRSDPNSRSSTAFYRIKNRDNKDTEVANEFRYHQRAYDNIFQISKLHTCD
jgi:hypothetical protein